MYATAPDIVAIEPTSNGSPETALLNNLCKLPICGASCTCEFGLLVDATSDSKSSNIPAIIANNPIKITKNMLKISI